MAKSNPKPAPKSKPAAKAKPSPKKASKPVTKSSPKSKSKPVVKPAKKPVPKPKAKPAKARAKPVKLTKIAPAAKPAKHAFKPVKSRPIPASKKAPAKSIVSAKSAKSAKSVPVKAKPTASKSVPAKTRPAKSAPAKAPKVKAPPAKAPPAKTSPGKAPHAKTPPAKTPPAKTAQAKAQAPAKTATKAAKAPAPKTPAVAPASARDRLRSRILAQKTKPAKPVAFSLDEVREVAKTAAKAAPAPASATKPVVVKAHAGKSRLPSDSLRAAKPAHIKAASLADILGFNPKQKSSHAEVEEALIPDKFKRYYKLLIALRNHVTGQVDQHAEETLKRSAKEDSGDLSSYGTDGGTDSFDRDFALSLVANEQEALSEVEAAIKRIKAGTYGICEHTQQPINRERLVAVPFTRFTAAAMKEVEKTRYKVRGQTGILGEGEEGAKVEDDSGGDE